MKLFVLIGKSASGKSTIEKELHKKGYNKITSCTTRPKRKNEIEGMDYYYLTEEEFNNKLNNDDLLESTIYRNWHYSIDKTKLENKDYIVVLEPHGYNQVIEKLGQENVIGIYVYSRWYKRLRRSFKRDKITLGKTLEIFRRLISDTFLFKGIKGKVKYVVNNFDLDKTVSFVEQIVKMESDLQLGDKVRIIDIKDKIKASHLTDFIGQEGYIVSWIIADNVKKYKVLLDEETGETAYFRKNELEVI